MRHKPVAIVEDRSNIDDFIRVVIDQIAEVPEMPIDIEDHGVEQKHLKKSAVVKNLGIIHGENADTGVPNLFETEQLPVSMS